jgi:hypothetical protein
LNNHLVVNFTFAPREVKYDDAEALGAENREAARRVAIFRGAEAGVTAAAPSDPSIGTSR